MASTVAGTVTTASGGAADVAGSGRGRTSAARLAVRDSRQGQGFPALSCAEAPG